MMEADPMGIPMARGMRLALALWAFMAVATVAVRAADYAAWAHSADFRLNTTASGADVSGDVADFPLLLRLDSAVFPFAQAKVDGGDIRFSGPGDQALDFEVERWDASRRIAEIWVKVPLVRGRSDSGFVRMHWGNPAAAPSSDGRAVFAAGAGYAGVWHLQGDAVKDAAGNAAAGDGTRSEKAAGIIAEGRALTGNNQGITVPDAKALDMSGAITVSAWIKAETWSGGNRYILRKGESAAQYSLAQDPASDSLVWTLGGPTQGAVLKGPLPAAGAWHHLAATYDGAYSRIFLDGALVRTQAAGGALASTSDELAIGCRSAAGKPRNSFRGALDEVSISASARSADFIKLAYANQRAQQRLVLHPALVDCRADFGVSPDTTVPEGTRLILRGRAACASGFQWSAQSGPAPRILDPEVTELEIAVPRIAKDTSLVYRFTARFGSSDRVMDVAVRVLEAIPDPQFTLPAIDAWNGADSLVLTPSVSNLAAVKASRSPAINYAWTLSGPEVDTAWKSGALVLRRAAAKGALIIGLCADNGGPPLCKSATIQLDPSVGLAEMRKPPAPAGPGSNLRDAAGRWLYSGSRTPARWAAPARPR